MSATDIKEKRTRGAWAYKSLNSRQPKHPEYDLRSRLKYMAGKIHQSMDRSKEL